jgi:hypothetical protein
MRKISPIAGGLACVGLAGFPAAAADLDVIPPFDLCAVSGLNGKLEGAGGFIDNEADDGGRAHLLGSVSVPLNCAWGLQVDAGIGDLAGSTAGGLAAHLFTRDPTSHLLGAYAQWGAVGSDDVWRLGAEAEYYLGNISLEGLAGWEDTDSSGSDLFAALTLAYYPQDNLRLNVGYQRFFDTDAAAAGFEWLPVTSIIGSPVSFFAHAAVGDDDYATVFGGVRIYFGGPDKSLIRRHREDDPGAKGIFQLLNENAQSSAAAIVPPVVDTKLPD